MKLPNILKNRFASSIDAPLVASLARYSNNATLHNNLSSLNFALHDGAYDSHVMKMELKTRRKQRITQFIISKFSNFHDRFNTYLLINTKAKNKYQHLNIFKTYKLRFDS